MILLLHPAHVAGLHCGIVDGILVEVD